MQTCRAKACRIFMYIENVNSMRALLDFGCESLFLSLFVTSVCRGWIIWTHTRNDTRRTDDAVDAHVASDATKERKNKNTRNHNRWQWTHIIIIGCTSGAYNIVQVDIKLVLIMIMTTISDSRFGEWWAGERETWMNVSHTNWMY